MGGSEALDAKCRGKSKAKTEGVSKAVAVQEVTEEAELDADDEECEGEKDCEEEKEEAAATEQSPSGLDKLAVVPFPAKRSSDAEPGTLFDGNVYCEACKTFQPLSRSRLRAKGADKWRCYSCHSKMSQLRRAHGKWPNAAFTALDEDQRAQFWSQISTLSGQQMIKQSKNCYLCTRRQQSGSTRAANFCRSQCGQTKDFASKIFETKACPAISGVTLSWV